MDVLLPEAGMIEKKKKMKQDSEHTCRALPQSLLHKPRGHDGVPGTTQTRPFLLLMYGTCCLYGAVRNGFEAGKIHYTGHWKGFAPEIETFLGSEMASSEASAIWALKKIEISRSNPYQCPE
jgi:hypothetical protein